MLTNSNIVQAVEAPPPAEGGAAGHSFDLPPEGAAAAMPRHAAYLPVKFAAEWLLAFTILTLSSPLVLALACLVKTTSAGPAFYAQTRLGKNGRRYRMFKLRTMVHNAEKGVGAVWAKKDDVRITPLGRFLRATHLDEVPQLWNVLRGEMSLIGPRPERPEIAVRVERQLPGFRRRLLVRPGITGLAQMLLPADDPEDKELKGLRKKLAHDLYYVREVGLLLDLRIAMSTPCYFIAAAIDAVQRALVKSYGRAAAAYEGAVAEEAIEGTEAEGWCDPAATGSVAR